MTASSQPEDHMADGRAPYQAANEPVGEELGTTAQFRAFVSQNDDEDEARSRAAVDPDGARSAPSELPEDRDVQFSAPAPVRSAPPSVRPPELDLPPAELGSTAQFRAFATSDDEDLPVSGQADGGGAAARPAADAVLPEDHDPTSAELMNAPNAPLGAVQPSDLPPVNPDNKRSLYIALAVIALVVIVVALLFLVG